MDGLHKSKPTNTPPSFTEKMGYVSPKNTLSQTEVLFRPHKAFVVSERPKFSVRTFVIIFSLALLVLLVGATSFFLYKSLSVAQSIQIDNSKSASFFSHIKYVATSLVAKNASPLLGESTGRINILLLGRAGERYPGRNLTDTVMVMSIDTEHKKVSLLSLPRDLFVPIPNTGLSTKINSLYQYGLSEGVGIHPLRTSIETITGQPLHYYFILDFDGFEQVVDALGGIHVDVVRDFFDPRYPGKNYSYETFEIKKGWQTLDGATALKYVRERHNDPEGDFGRAKRQQQVLQAIKDRAFSLGTFFNVFTVNSVLDALGKNIQTDMPIEAMEQFLILTKSLDTKNVATVVIDAWKKESLLRVSHIQVGPVAAFILVPRVGNWSELQDVSTNIFSLDEIKNRRAKIRAESATLTIRALPNDLAVAQKMKTYILEELGFSTVLLESNALKNRPEESMIVDRTELRKPYSLDELLKKFSLKKAEPSSLPVTLSASRLEETDFVITIGSDLSSTLSFDEDTVNALLDDTSFPEVLPPQPRTR